MCWLLYINAVGTEEQNYKKKPKDFRIQNRFIH